MRYALVTTKEVPDGGGQRASGILYLETVAEPLDWPGQGFKEYRCDPSTGLTFDPSVVSHTCLYLPACIYPVSCTSPVPAASYLPSTQYLALNCPLNSWTLQLDLYPRQSVEAVRRKCFVILLLSVSSALYCGVSLVDLLQLLNPSFRDYHEPSR